MEIPQPGRRPGDSIIDRYMPGVTEAAREAARENLYAYVAALLRIANRRQTKSLSRRFAQVVRRQ